MSEIKVNKITPRVACGTVTLGDSGDTFTVPSGATLPTLERHQDSLQQEKLPGAQQLKQQEPLQQQLV